MPAMYPGSPDRGLHHPDHHETTGGSGTSGRLGSGVLSQPAQLPLAFLPATPTSATHEVNKANEANDLSELARYAANSEADAAADGDDLAPTEPQLPSMLKLPRVKPLPSSRLRIATAFSEFMLAQDWTHDAALASVPMMRRMRIFSTLAPIYLSVVQATGRMELP